MELPSSLAVAAFDHLLVRGQIIHLECTFRGHDGAIFQRSKFAVVLNATLPDDPVFAALATSKVAHYSKTKLFTDDVIAIPAGSYAFLSKDTIISLRSLHQFDIDELRKQYAAKTLTIVGKLHKVHLDQVDTILQKSLLIERWKLKRCSVAAPPPPA